MTLATTARMLHRLFFLLVLSATSTVALGNWTTDYDPVFAEFAFDFAAAAYALDPEPCLAKHNATLIRRVQTPCDAVHDECWAFIAVSDSWIVMSVRGTKTKLQLITELVETMSAPKKTFPAGGSVQRYFFEALKSLWKVGFWKDLISLRKMCPKCKLLFTGHSLGGAIASLASTQFVFNNSVPADQVFLVTFGQPRVGNMDYAGAHDKLVPNSWRLIHRYDIVAHLPYCYETIVSHHCSPLYNHGPWHHGTEIWYPEDMDSSTSIYRVCSGTPANEDDSCSNGYYVHYEILDHLTYLDKDVSLYGGEGCKPTRSNRTKPRRKFLTSTKETEFSY